MLRNFMFQALTDDHEYRSTDFLYALYKYTSCSRGQHARIAFKHFRPLIALRTDLSHITTELWEIPALRMAH